MAPGGTIRAAYAPPEQRPGSSEHLQEHADPDVRVSFPDISGCRPRRCGDNGDERSSNGVSKIDAECDGKERHEDHASAQAGQCPDKASSKRAQPKKKSERQDTHAADPSLVPRLCLQEPTAREALPRDVQADWRFADTRQSLQCSAFPGGAWERGIICWWLVSLTSREPTWEGSRIF